jgi:hypothetical protein
MFECPPWVRECVSPEVVTVQRGRLACTNLTIVAIVMTS